jgi:hypothetical protein
LISSEFLASPDPLLLRLLLKLGADFNSTLNYFNQAPLSCVLACLGHLNILKEISQYLGCKFASVPSDLFICSDENDTNLLCYATQHNQLECCRFILENSIDPVGMLTRPDASGYCAFTYVVSMAKHDLLELLDFYLKFLLTSKEVEENVKTMLIEQALVLSAANSNKNCLNYLIDLCILNRLVLILKMPIIFISYS